MNYGLLVKGLLNEARSGIQFNRMNKAARAFAVIGLIPLIVSTFFAVCGFYVLVFIYKGLSSPIDFLHKLVKKEGQEVKHGTQVVIYWCCFPLIFIAYVFYSFFSVFFYFAWFGLMLNVYLVTLGGVKWQPFLTDASYDEVRSWAIRPSNTAANAWAIIVFVLDCLAAILFLAGLATDIGMGAFGVFMAFIMIMILIVNPLTFKKSEVELDEEEEVEEADAE